jgi:hypothetical protein
MRARPTESELIMKSGDTGGPEPPSPQTHRRLTHLQALCSLPITEAVFGHQNDLRSAHQRSGQAARAAIDSSCTRSSFPRFKDRSLLPMAIACSPGCA